MAKNLPALLITIGCLLPTFAAAQNGNCAEGWDELTYDDGGTPKSECYQYHSEKLTWPEAMTLCRGIHWSSNVMTIRSDAESQVVYDLWASYNDETRGNGLWIGLRRITKDDGSQDWFTPDTPWTQLGYFNWNEDQPQPPKRDCVEMKMGGKTPVEHQKWTTRRCNKLRSFICNMATGYVDPQGVISPYKGGIVPE